MLVIRLRRKGKKNQPFFRVIIVDKKRSSTGGRAVEIVGNIDPLTKKRHFDKERILYWISKGAKPSPAVHNLLVSEKIIEAKKINVSKKPKKSAEGEAKPTEAEVATPAEAPKEPSSAKATEGQGEVKTEEAKPEEEKKPEKPKAEQPKEESKKEEAKPEEKPVQ